MLVASAGSRVPWRLVDAEEEDGPVGVENILRPVAVMDVPIGDQNAANAMFFLRVSRRDCNCIEDAEAHSARRTSVMTGRTSDGEGIGNSLLDDRIYSVQRSAGGT